MLLLLLLQLPSAWVGTWRGTSTCLVHPSPCHDEVVVYHITRSTTDSTHLTWQANKIVNGVEEEMGTIDCAASADQKTITCAIPRGTWRFTREGDTVTGGLWLDDGTKFRTVAARRAGA